jgi:hypothetical protein
MLENKPDWRIAIFVLALPAPRPRRVRSMLLG